VLLDLDAETAVARRAKTGSAPDRLEREKVEFFEKVRSCYLELAAAEAERFLVIDATETIEGIQLRIRDRVAQLLSEA
jgi:dTMP kinase